MKNQQFMNWDNIMTGLEMFHGFLQVDFKLLQVVPKTKLVKFGKTMVKKVGLNLKLNSVFHYGK